ncbi:Secretory phospholipase A2 receptor [Larimichthys crocea]|uniref:Secretory phospholipase A2 receptor n=1 Tax=Larimichthys crocea TaxID=215358 RepID=A0A6G0JBV8_LARCR|nr:C-type mannose receptor 2 [Larimichthys crocea]KAE8301087.1 Secretory phospholipase A2 receptor [Larimichthys crocea]
MTFITMKSSLIFCVLLCVVLSVRAASLPLSEESSTVELITTPVTTVPNLTSYQRTIYDDTTMMTTVEDITTATPVTSCNTSPPSTTPIPTTIYDDTTMMTTVEDITTPVTSCNTSPPSTTPIPTIHYTPSQMMCPEGWEVFQGRCYFFVATSVTWSQAQSSCAMMDSMLVSVHSAEEYGFLQQLTTSNELDSAWLGGFYLQDQWLWIDGSWFYNNTWGYMIDTERSNPCLVLNSYEDWSNSPCNPDSYPYICMKPSNVPTSMLCPQGWTGFVGRCYYYNENSLTWADADTSCAGLQASLVSVHNPQEYAFLYQQTDGFGSAWLGGFYLEDQWLWLDGSWFYQGFFTDMSVPDTTQACLTTYTPEGWTNFPCDNTYPSFCVKDAVV